MSDIVTNFGDSVIRAEGRIGNRGGARLKALEAVTQEYTNLFKILTADLFQLTHEHYIQKLSIEIHAQADLARRLSFEMDWVWQQQGR